MNNIFLTIDQQRLLAGRESFNNYLARTLFLRASTGQSNYNAAFVTLRKRLSRGLLYALNYTYSRSLDQLGAVQNTANVTPNSFALDAEYGPSTFDFTHLFNGTWLYELPFGKGKRFAANVKALDKVIEGWYVSGIFTAQSGDPLTVSQGPGVWGGSLFLGFNSGAIPTSDLGSFGNTAHRGVAGSNNIGINGSPAAGGSGLNLFENPEAVFIQFSARRDQSRRARRAGEPTPRAAALELRHIAREADGDHRKRQCGLRLRLLQRV